MSRYRKIDTRIWNDEKFRGLSDEGKLAFFFILTHPNMTALGAMRATLPGLAAELEWPPEGFRQAFGEALSKGMAEHDEKGSVIALPNFLKYNQPESPNVVKAWAACLDLIPEGDLKTLTIQRAKAFLKGKTKAFTEALPKAFAEALAKPMPNQEQEQEQEQEPNSDGSGGERLTPTPAREDPNILLMPMAEAKAYLEKQQRPANAYAAAKGITA
ncbi:hypothetical protein AB4Z43_32960 [Mesorhizobium sp. 2RAF45]|uniref:hypothetical protein n=1 Tax=Mesorhizobium sp. 2RAF45 TaxID=3233001 RepID=UPI003F9D31CD